MRRRRFLSTPSARRATIRKVALVHTLRISIHALREEGDSITVSISPPDNIISIHALREEGDKPPCAPALMLLQFLSTPSARRATRGRCRTHSNCRISIHALREEGDGISSPSATVPIYFYPRPPRGGRLGGFFSGCVVVGFLSTPSARRATTYECFKRRIKPFLSTPSARRATKITGKWDLQILFLSTPSARRATTARWALAVRSRFLSTPSARRATSVRPVAVHAVRISIHALREEGDHPPRRSSRRKPISIHALREEGDVMQAATMPCPAYFYPRPPRGGRPCGRPWKPRRHTHFYPRPPRGGRLFRDGVILSLHIFLSTPSARRATYVAGYVTKKTYISIHALREEGDVAIIRPSLLIAISIHALREEGDTSLSHLFLTSTDFYPRPPRGGRLLS